MTATRINPWIPVVLWAAVIFTLSSVPDLGKHDLEDEAVDLLSESSARRYAAVPYRLEGSAVCVAIADPSDDATLDAVLEEVSRPVRFVVATRTEVDSAIREAFGEPFSPA